MRVAVTGATGFLGRYIVNELLGQGYECRCWYRPGHSDREGFYETEQSRIDWIHGDLGDHASMHSLVKGADAVVHAALSRPGAGFMGAEGELIGFVETNLVGTLRLIREAVDCGVSRFIFISTCAVHDVILDDRPLDETHPLWPKSHYGAHKAAIEKFVHSFGFGEGYPICALRPTGIYGIARPVEKSKWFRLVQDVKAGKPIDSAAGGKEVHAADVARAVSILLRAPDIAGQSYNCYDMYISDEHVAGIAKRLSHSNSEISRRNKGPKHQIVTDKLRELGMTFGGEELLERTVAEMLRCSG
ncbi:MAG TPA: NAD(P)-dependent oxidoreductase [Phycisphaerae bacterium]|nr:NAD(P)-dependent oxidoreductase [Phycisphaerae bacterium]HOJ76021.1 NAD(P)-dependent oxidoreductase [Phycisphaerae bacterium]HOM52784.1 NAD(P)-dependent oxidoreductase [Phycisphaerae bacterium]HON65633.1 NAD(P)-dependent oxidoreductase [Phycisphaerae bacterium]HOQ86780.1 NAD(P)-dependent oxidoreductase [Phycisphaerae bacterium]